MQVRTALVLAIAALGCGGAPPPPAAPPPAPSDEQPTRTVPMAAAEDDEIDEGIELQSTRGQLEVDAIVASLAPYNQALSDCYLSRIGARRWLGGEVALHWEIDALGEVQAVRLAESNLGAWEIERCLLEIARGVRFAKPRGGATGFSIPLAFTPRGGALIWDEDQSLRAVGGQIFKLDECSKPSRGKPRPPKRPKDVVITLYVGPLGKAQSVGFASATSVLEDAWADCAAKIALAWRLPDPRGRIAKLAVRYR